MAAHAKSHDEHTKAGTWRGDRHGGLVDARGVPGVEHDSVLWNQLEQWQQRFDDAAEDVAANGTTLDSRGQAVQNPAAKMMKDASSEIRELCKILGIGPLNRSRLGAAPEDEGSDSDDAPARKRE